MDFGNFELRKRDHIQLALDPRHQATGSAGLDRIHLFHEALPELDFQDVSLETRTLGREARTPFFVAGMTAGHKDARELNRRIAEACQERGWAMGVGSQRRELESDSSELDRWKEIRKSARSIPIFANLGLSQLVHASTEAVQRVVDALEADALAIHLNALQEALQPEGTPNFKGGLGAITRLCLEISVPIVLKETGCGFSPRTLEKISELPIGALDASGLGGTHWGRIEGARSPEGSLLEKTAQSFAHWGESTVSTVFHARKILPEKVEIWATGGVRSGLDAAKLIALGANLVGYAKPALESALQGEKELRDWMELQERELKTALFCTGCATPRALSSRGDVWTIA